MQDLAVFLPSLSPSPCTEEHPYSTVQGLQYRDGSSHEGLIDGVFLRWSSFQKVVPSLWKTSETLDRPPGSWSPACPLFSAVTVWLVSGFKMGSVLPCHNFGGHLLLVTFKVVEIILYTLPDLCFNTV